MSERPRVPNLVLRRIREVERHETRAEFAEALVRKAAEIGEAVYPSERYVARLEDGDVKYPYPAYRRVLTELCERPMAELGFIRHGKPSTSLPVVSPVEPESAADAAQRHNESVMAQQWPAWFGARVASMLALVENWNEPAIGIDSLQNLLHEEIMMFDAAAPDHRGLGYTAHSLARRQALVTLAALPTAFVTANRLFSSETRSLDARRDLFLARCAASITACWHLLRGSDLSTVDELVSAYLLQLERIARQQSKYQQMAATLASQAHRIFRIISLHRNTLRVLEQHSKQAVYFANIASDASCKATAMISLANTHFYSGNPETATRVYERALVLQERISPLLRSRMHAELSVVYGQMGRVQEAIRSAELSEEDYPDEPEHDPSFLYAEFTPASLALEKGLAYVALAEQLPSHGYQNEATDILSAIDDGGTTPTPDRIRFEIANNQARAAVLLDDVDAFEVYITRGLEGVALLGSNQRRREARLAWQRAIDRWPHERRIQALNEQLQLTRGNS